MRFTLYLNYFMTLIYVCFSADKESWLPTLECLFELQAKAPNDRFTIIEAWSVDSPNHGRAATTNEARLMNRPEGICEYLLPCPPESSF